MIIWERFSYEDLQEFKRLYLDEGPRALYDELANRGIVSNNLCISCGLMSELRKVLEYANREKVEDSD